MPELAIIVPYVNEMPQLVFTLRGIAEELRGEDFEIVAVDNWCRFLEENDKGVPVRVPDKGHDRLIDATDKNRIYGLNLGGPPGVRVHRAVSHIEAMAKKHSWLRHVRYEDKLSHWNAKNVGVANSINAKYYWFMDAHTMLSKGAVKAFHFYKKNWRELQGTLHLPWTYHILESQRLIYKMVVDDLAGVYHYSTLNLPPKIPSDPFEVPVMTTCGMMMHREYFHLLGGWPKALGIYGGGENFVNYVSAILGLKKWVYPDATIYHMGEKRGYNWYYDNYQLNRMIALYMIGGLDLVWRFLEKSVKGHHRILRKEMMELAQNPHLQMQRKTIMQNQQVCLSEWVAKWIESGKFVSGTSVQSYNG